MKNKPATASMRPPDLPGGNGSGGWPHILACVMCFNEAAGFTRRKRPRTRGQGQPRV